MGLVVLPFVPSSIVQGQEREVRNERPNIIFIMSDDHARQAIWGSERIVHYKQANKI